MERISRVKTNQADSLAPWRRSFCVRTRDLWRRTVASEFIQKVAETFTTRIVLMGIALVTSVLLARILGPEGRGLFAVAAAIGSLGVQFGNLGLHASNTYSVARDNRLLPALVSNTLVVSLLFGSLFGVLTYLVFTLRPEWAPLGPLLLVLSLGWVPFGLAYLLLQNLFLGIHDVRNYNKVELAERAGFELV